jgi:hypothetical protein
MKSWTDERAALSAGPRRRNGGGYIRALALTLFTACMVGFWGRGKLSASFKSGIPSTGGMGEETKPFEWSQVCCCFLVRIGLLSDRAMPYHA